MFNVKEDTFITQIQRHRNTPKDKKCGFYALRFNNARKNKTAEHLSVKLLRGYPLFFVMEVSRRGSKGHMSLPYLAIHKGRLQNVASI